MATTGRTRAKRANNKKAVRTPAGRSSAKDDGDLLLALRSAVEWEAWLRANHARSAAVFLRIRKKSSASTLTYATALDVALAWGWIDSQKRALDETAWLQRFTARTPRSPWSKINRAKAEASIASGRMEASAWPCRSEPRQARRAMGPRVRGREDVGRAGRPHRSARRSRSNNARGTPRLR